MISNRVLLLLLCCVLALSQRASSEHCPPQELTQWLGSSLAQIEKIQLGMTRSDVEKLFVSDGGMSTRYRKTFVFRDCPYIKIDVEFTSNDENGKPIKEEPADRITLVSKPYLAQPTAD